MDDCLPGFIQPLHFSVADGHHYVDVCAADISGAQDGRSVKFIEGTLAELEITEWLHHQGKFARNPVDGSVSSWELRVLMSRPRRDPGLSVEPFSFSQTTYNDVVDAFRIPATFLSLVASHTTLVTTYELSDTGYGMLANLSSHGLVLSHNPKTHRTACFVVGLCEHQITRCKSELRKFARQGSSPMLFPAIWLDVFIETRVRRAEGRTKGILDIQLRTGLHWSVETPKNRVQSLDFNDLTYALTVLGSELAWDEFCLTMLGKIQGKLMAAHKAYISKLSTSQRDPRKRCLGANSCDDVASRLINSKDIVFGLKGKTKHTSEQVKVQLQAIYNLISQTDNRLATSTAEATRRIAEALQQDNAIMRCIAEDSNQVAILARRDSADMRVIAVVTLIFLPATFTATFFSTSFFDFRVKSPNRIVSSWLWLYCVLTIVLTVIVLASWHFIAHRRHKGLRNSLQHESSWSNSMRATSQNLALSGQQFGDGGLESTEKAHVMLHIKTGNIASSIMHNQIENNSQHDRASSRQVFPASKVIFKGVMDDEKSCACCARPL